MLVKTVLVSILGLALAVEAGSLPHASVKLARRQNRNKPGNNADRASIRSSTTAKATATATTNQNQNNNNNNNNNNNAANTCLQANAIQTGTFFTGQQGNVAIDGQVNSKT
jgi:hypothetical protein